MSNTNAENATPAKTSGLKAPTKIARPSGLQKPTAIGLASASTTSITPPQISAAQSTSSLIQQSSLQATSSASNTGGDTYKVGERVWVNGNKPGVIAFIGETKFKEGEWFGVILETADGKNNGTVDGVSYFQTEENRGIFCRSSKLSKTQQNETAAATTTTASTVPPTESTQPSTTITSAAATATYGFNIGERVIVNSSNGAKKGYLRFIGLTEFAKGI